MRVIAIDPGNIESAYVILDEYYNLYGFAKVNNSILAEMLDDSQYDHMALEMIASYGMAVGASVFDTCVWIGRFWEIGNADLKNYVYRKDVKMNLCSSMKAKDSNIRQALIDRFAKHDMKNGKGTKKCPDVFYGFKSDIWAAMAVGVTYLDKMEK